MKKLVKAVENINLVNTEITTKLKEELVVAYVCAEPETETEKLYRDIVGVTLKDLNLLREQKFFDTLNALSECMPYAATEERYMEITDIHSMIIFLRTIKHFKNEGVDVKFDDIVREIMEPEKIHKFKKIMDQVDELMKGEINLITFKK